MSQKVLPQYLTDIVPPLVGHYKSACSKVYGEMPFVAKKYYAKFRVLEDDLRELNYDLSDYAYVVCRVMKKFVASKQWKCLPPHVFVGSYCLKRYKKVAESETVTIDKVSDEDYILQDEIFVARTFVSRNLKSDSLVRMSTIVQELEPLLSKAWLQVYTNKSKRPEIQAVDQLVFEFGISKPVCNYLDIVSALR